MAALLRIQMATIWCSAQHSYVCFQWGKKHESSFIFIQFRAPENPKEKCVGNPGITLLEMPGLITTVLKSVFYSISGVYGNHIEAGSWWSIKHLHTLSHSSCVEFLYVMLDYVYFFFINRACTI